MCESSAGALAAVAAAARRSHAPQQSSMFDGLNKMAAQAAKAASEGRHIPSTAERMAAMDATARQCLGWQAATAAVERRPGARSIKAPSKLAR